MPRINISTKELNGKYISVDDLSLKLNCNKDKIFSILHYIKANIYYIGKNRFISNNDIDIIKSYVKMYSVKEAFSSCKEVIFSFASVKELLYSVACELALSLSVVKVATLCSNSSILVENSETLSALDSACSKTSLTNS